MKRFLRVVVLSIAAPMWAISGCTDVGAPTEPALLMAPAELSFNAGESGADMSALAMFKAKPQIRIAWAKKWISPAGGRLDFQGFAIEVPAGAVESLTQFSIHLPVDPHGSERVVARFGPHGATFAQPVTIEFPLAGTSIESSPSAKVVWWDGSAWIDIGGSKTAGGERMSAPTDHFSTYGTSDDSLGGGVTASGG